MQLFLNHACFPGLSVREFLEVARAAGAQGVDLIAGPPGEIAEAAQATGMPVGAIHALRDWALPDDPDPLPALTHLVEAALAARAGLVICVAPLRMEALPPPEILHASAVERLRALAAFTRSHGIRLALEQVGQSSSRPDALSGIRTLEAARRIAADA